MGKIKETILPKKDRPAPEQKPPSMRRMKRSMRSVHDNARSGRNNRYTPSRTLNLRGLRKLGSGVDRREQFKQDIPASVVFKFKKKHAPRVGVTHEHYSDERKDKAGTKKIMVLTCPMGDYARIRQFEQWENEGKGKVSYQRRKTIWHLLRKQDEKTFKQTKPKR